MSESQVREMERKDEDDTIKEYEQVTFSSSGAQDSLAVPMYGEDSRDDEHQPLLSKKIAERKRGKFIPHLCLHIIVRSYSIWC